MSMNCLVGELSCSHVENECGLLNRLVTETMVKSKKRQCEHLYGLPLCTIVTDESLQYGVEWFTGENANTGNNSPGHASGDRH